MGTEEVASGGGSFQAGPHRMGPLYADSPNGRLGRQKERRPDTSPVGTPRSADPEGVSQQSVPLCV